MDAAGWALQANDLEELDKLKSDFDKLSNYRKNTSTDTASHLTGVAQADTY
jgi:hypothetical protein